MAQSITGPCHLCGATGKLSFEHVPPQSAFNDRRVLHTAFAEILASENLDRLPGRYQQRGAGAYTLCVKCNTDTGRWYGAAYAEWSHQAMEILLATRGNPSLIHPYNLFPLRVLKQVVCMFFSVNGSRFQRHQPDLVRFVLNRDSRIFPPHVRVYVFYTLSERSRAAAVTGLMRGFGTSRSSLHVFSEITFPPFGFVMTLDNTPPPDARFCEISGFSRLGYRDYRTGLAMRLPLMPIYTGYPGDYRTRDEAIAELEHNRRLEEEERRAQLGPTTGTDDTPG